MIHGTDDLRQYLADQENERREIKQRVREADAAKREREAIEETKRRIAEAAQDQD